MKRLILLTIFAHLTIVFSALLFVRVNPESSVAAIPISTSQLIPITLTAYSPSKTQTSGRNPFEMASTLIAAPNDLWQLKYVAISRDLKANYDVKWGDKIFIEFEVQDLMGKTAGGKKVTKTIDLFTRSQDTARNFGRQKRRVIILLNE